MYVSILRVVLAAQPPGHDAARTAPAPQMPSTRTSSLDDGRRLELSIGAGPVLAHPDTPSSAAAPSAFSARRRDQLTPPYCSPPPLSVLKNGVMSA